MISPETRRRLLGFIGAAMAALAWPAGRPLAQSPAAGTRLELTLADVVLVRGSKVNVDGKVIHIPPSLTLRLTPEGATTFGDFTTKYINKRSRLIVAGKTILEPRISSPIMGGELQIGGMPLETDLEPLAAQLKLANKITVEVID